MSEESAISINNLQNVEGDISNSTENVNHQSEGNCTNGNDNNVTNGSASENETEKYEKLNKVMYILGINVLMLILHSCLSLVLAVIYACNGHPRFCLATYGTILVLNLFIVFVSHLWKYSKETNIRQIIISGLASAICSAEIPIYYYDCHRLHKLKSNYKQTLQHVDDLKVLSLATALQAVLQLLIQCVLIWLYGTETCFILPLQIAVMVFSSLCLMWAILTFSYCKYNDELGERHRVSILDLALTLLSLIFYVLDVVSDIFVAVKFFYFHQCLYAGLTLSFVLFPSIYITWFRHYNNNADLVVCCYCKSLKLIRKVKKIELAEPLNSKCSEDRNIYHIELVENNFNVAIFRYNESYTESILQLILQIAILLSQFNSFSDMFHKDVLRSEWIQMLSIVLSSINLNISSVTMFQSKRIHQNRTNEKLSEDDPLSRKGMVIQFFGYFFTVVTRILAISFAASTFPVSTTSIHIGNWMLLFLFLRIQQKTSPLPYKIGQSVIYTFTPPINDVKTEMFFQVLYLVENVLLTMFWARTHLQPSARCTPVYLTFACNIVGIVFRIWYQMSYKKLIKKK